MRIYEARNLVTENNGEFILKEHSYPTESGPACVISHQDSISNPLALVSHPVE